MAPKSSTGPLHHKGGAECSVNIIARVVVLCSRFAFVCLFSIGVVMSLFVFVCLFVSLSLCFSFSLFLLSLVCRPWRCAQVTNSYVFPGPSWLFFLDPTVGFSARILGFMAFSIPGIWPGMNSDSVRLQVPGFWLGYNIKQVIHSSSLDWFLHLSLGTVPFGRRLSLLFQYRIAGQLSCLH